jgi:type I restriction enzyme S subunit
VSVALRPYPEYRQSRLPWLDSIPAHWEEKRTKYLFREVDERSATGTEEMLSVSHITGVTPRRQKNVTMFMAESNAGHKLCRPGDLVVNTMWAWMGALGVAKEAGLVSPSVYRPRQDSALLPDYVDRLLRTRAYVSEYIRRSTGIRPSRLRLYPDQMLDISVIHPPLDEQRVMLAFLESSDQAIRRYIRNKQRLIALLTEQKQAIIDRAVTRGVDDDGPLAPTGIEWLGDVPAHWPVRSLKQIALVRLSGVDKVSVEGECPVRLCNYTDVYNRDSITQDVDFMLGTATRAEVAGLGLREGDVLITKDSEMWDDIAIPALVVDDLENVLCGYHLALIRPDPMQVTGEFLFRAFTAPTLARQFNVAATGVTRYGISKHVIKTAVFPVPGVEEQQRICQWITDELSPLASAVARTRSEIGLAREYRTRLIADVVTGKLDVRHVALDAPAMENGRVWLEEVEATLSDGEGEDVEDLDVAEEMEGDDGQEKLSG